MREKVEKRKHKRKEYNEKKKQKGKKRRETFNECGVIVPFATMNQGFVLKNKFPSCAISVTLSVDYH
jgi:hypothetical protein